MSAAIDTAVKAKFATATKALNARMQASGVAMSDAEQKAHNPVTHDFGDGVYIRRIVMPAGQVIVSRVHKRKHPFFILRGAISVLTEDGEEFLEAPHHGMTPAGTQRVLFTHEETEFVTVHATELTDPDEIEAELTAEDFNDPAISHLVKKSLE